MAKERKVKVRFLLSPSGTFNLAYNVGEEGSLEEKQAAEVVEAGYAEYVDKADAKADESKNDDVIDADRLAEVDSLAKRLISENDALKRLNEGYLTELEALKKANPNPHGGGTLPIGATSGDLQTTLGVEEAKAAVSAPVTDTFDPNLAAKGTTTDVVNDLGENTGTKVSAAGETQTGEVNGMPAKTTKATSK